MCMAVLHGVHVFHVLNERHCTGVGENKVEDWSSSAHPTWGRRSATGQAASAPPTWGRRSKTGQAVLITWQRLCHAPPL